MGDRTGSDRSCKNFDFIADTEKALRFIMDYVDKNDYIVNSVIDSMGYKELREFLYQDLFSVIYEVVEQGEREIGFQPILSSKGS